MANQIILPLASEELEVLEEAPLDVAAININYEHYSHKKRAQIEKRQQQEELDRLDENTQK